MVNSLFQHYTLLTGIIIIPCLMLATNFVVRNKAGVTQSVAADIFLLLIVYDINVMVNHRAFEAMVQDPALQPHTLCFHATLLFFGFLAWVICVHYVEPVIAAGDDTETWTRNIRGFLGKYGLWAVSWAVVSIISVSHVLIMVLKVSDVSGAK